MNPKLRQICRCELCTIPRDMHIYLNRYRIRLVTNLQQKYVGSHTRKFLFSSASAANYKHKVFTYGECLNATIKYFAHYITCIPVNPKYMIHIKYDLGFFDERPE